MLYDFISDESPKKLKKIAYFLIAKRELEFDFISFGKSAKLQVGKL